MYACVFFLLFIQVFENTRVLTFVEEGVRMQYSDY